MVTYSETGQGILCVQKVWETVSKSIQSNILKVTIYFKFIL